MVCKRIEEAMKEEDGWLSFLWKPGGLTPSIKAGHAAVLISSIANHIISYNYHIIFPNNQVGSCNY